MTIDEAISHALEVAGEQQKRADSAELIDILDGLDVEACKECAADHRQLAEWLTDYKELREENKVLMQECDRLIKEKGELLKKLEQVAEYKRLLKAAVEDIHSRDYCNGCIYESAEGKEQYLNCEYHNCFKWRYADEALKLIRSVDDDNR